MADENVFGCMEDGTYLTTAPNPHVNLSGTIPTAAYIGQLFDTEIDSTDTVSITIRKDQTNWAIYSGAEFTSASPDSLDLSGATLIRSAGTISTSDSVVVMGLEPIPPDTGDAYYARRNGLLVDISDKIIDA